MARLKRAIESAKSAGLDAKDALLSEAVAQFQGESRADEGQKLARDALHSVLESSSLEFATLEQALRQAREAGLRASDLSEAETMLERLRKEQKKANKLEAKRRRAFHELEALAAKEADVAALRAAVAAASTFGSGGSLNSTEEIILRAAEECLRAAEWAALPLGERLERSSAAFGRDKCRPAVDAQKPSGMVCPSFRPAEVALQSRAVGETNCDHPTLKAGGPAAPQKNAAPPETSRYFCKYPPPFDLQEASSGDGYRKAEFDFPTQIFNATAMQEEDFLELAVLNLDMKLFRSMVAPCAQRVVWLIEFYVHWCPHCQATMPHLFKLAVAIRASGIPMRVGAVNCAAHSDLCSAFQVMGHPLIGFFYGGVGGDGRVQLFDYSGHDFRVNAALDSMKQNADPSWFAGAPQDMPKHLFPAEMANDLVRLLPDEYRPAETALRWLASEGSGKSGPSGECPVARKWRNPRGVAEGEETEEVVKPKSAFAGSGWMLFEHSVKPAQRLQDALQAVVYTLAEWAVPNPASESPNGFTYAELSDLHSWVALLAEALPTAVEHSLSLQAPLEALSETLAVRLKEVEMQDGNATVCIEEWRRWVAPVRAAFEAARAGHTRVSTCRTETCRLWSLLHILSVAPLARAEEGDATARTDVVNAGVFDAMTAFLRRYFTCRTCRTHFLEQVMANAFGLSMARSGGPGDLALWWYSLHIAVSIRVAKEGRCKADRRWPPADICGACWGAADSKKDDAAADEAAVLSELVRQYWPTSTVVEKISTDDEAASERTDEEEWQEAPEQDAERRAEL